MDLQTINNLSAIFIVNMYGGMDCGDISHNFLKVELNYGFYLYEEMKALFWKLFPLKTVTQRKLKRDLL